MASWFDGLRDWSGELPEKRQRQLVVALFMLAQLFIWPVVFEILWYGDRSISVTPVYYDYASRISTGMLLYRDFASAYPPVAMLHFSLPRPLSCAAYV